MKSSSYLDVLRGRSKEIPDVRSKVVRVFVSSTFTDTLAERDSLIENIFPKLKDYCRKNYGLEFQYVDMRWGIQTESADNHGEVATCLQEIEICKKYSVATNFVVLLSHRYGSRPIPANIRAPLFELLKQTVFNQHNENNDGDLLNQWYKLDTNCIPPVYILQNISSIIPNFISKDTDEIKQAEKEWKKVSNRLRICLRQAAKTCLQQQLITESDYDDFFISITEKEIINGILSAKDANERTLCFLREIVDIREHLSDEKASKYIDMSSKTEVDEEAEKLLDRLKNSRIPSVLKSENIFKYNVKWSPNGITRQDHSGYIEEFNNEFYDAMKEQIDRCVKSRYTKGSDSLEHEVLEHAIQCKTYVTKFHGRSDILSELEKYVKNNKEYRPCVIYGDSGCGKTSVLAKTATEVFKWWPNRSVSVVLRFLGTTPSSSTIYKTLLSISEQISEIYNIPITSYPTINQLRDQLESNLLSQIPTNEYLVLLLDSIDQLDGEAYDCKWLLKQFPSNVKCIISVLPGVKGIFENLKHILTEDENVFINVPPFDATTVEIVYNDWLKMKNRSLSDEQRLFINDLMKKKEQILPLFMKLVFDIISVWHSYDSIDKDLNELNDVDDCIRYLFKRLEVIHNKVLFSRSLCYMTACRSGISQNELEDILSLDDDVLKSVFQHYIPPVRRLPGILWTRIRNDLDEYITEKEVDDAPVIYWYHRRFIEVAQQLYISNLGFKDEQQIFQNVVDLFKETWKGKDKPFKIDDPKLVTKYKLDKSGGEIQANRFTTSQPIEFIDMDGRIQYNKRKLNELPHFLSKLDSDIALPIAVEEMFFNYSFMHAKYTCSSYSDVLGDLFKYAYEEVSSDDVENLRVEVYMLAMTSMLFAYSLTGYPNNYAFELTSRFITLYGLKPHFTKLIQQCDEQSPRHCAFIVPYYQLPPAGNGLIYSMNKHTLPVVHLDVIDNPSVAASLSNKIVVLNLNSGDASIDINLPQLNEPYLYSTLLANTIAHHSDQNNNKWINDDHVASTGSEDEYDENFKYFTFFVNSCHHVYLISSYGDIIFHQESKKGFLTAEVINKKFGLCILVEQNSNSVQFWNMGQNTLFAKIDLSTNASIKKVFFIKLNSLIINIVLYDGTILIYTLNDSKFIHRGTVNGGKHLDLVIADQDKLICTFDSTIPIDFAYIDLNPLSKTDEVLSDNGIVKTLIAFNPSITPKPIQRIILPDGNKESTAKSMKIFFIIVTKECLYIVHTCMEKDISYVRIPGQFDVIATHVNYPNTALSARGGTIDIFKWKCIEGEHDKNEKCDIYHEYELFVCIDISSCSVLTIKPMKNADGWFLCSMQNGVIHLYDSGSVRRYFKKTPPFPRTRGLIGTFQLSGTKAVTLDISKQELACWLYQHSTSIESKRLFTDSTKIDDYAVLSDKDVLFITNTYWAEIYALDSLNKEPLWRLEVRSPTRVFTFDENTFILITNDGSIRCINQQINQTSNEQLKIKCSRLFTSVLTLNSKPSLIVLSDDQHSLAIYTSNNIIYMNIDLSQYSSTSLLQMTSEKDAEVLLFYFENKSLLSCRIQLSSKQNSYHLTPFGTADMYCLKNNCLATITNGENRLNLYNIHPYVCHEPIQLENECDQLCLNESGDYVFALVKPRILCMYRVNDRRQLGRLYAYDSVAKMIASKDFVILGMNDRRLLTLMIADPDDPELQSKIQALPSRQLKRHSHSAGKHVTEQVQRFMDLSSDDSDGDFGNDNEMDSKQLDIHNMRKIIQPVTSYRYVHRLNGKHSLTKMKTDQSFRTYFLKNYAGVSHLPDTSEIVIDDSDAADDDDDIVIQNHSSQMNPSIEKEHNLDDIREKTLEFDRQQIKGIQLANAGANNPRVINNYSVTSSTCMLM